MIAKTGMNSEPISTRNSVNWSSRPSRVDPRTDTAPSTSAVGRNRSLREGVRFTTEETMP